MKRENLRTFLSLSLMEGDEKVHTRNSIFWDNSYNEKTSINIVNFRGAISVRYHMQTVKTALASEITIHRMIKMFQKKKNRQNKISRSFNGKT